MNMLVVKPYYFLVSITTIIIIIIITITIIIIIRNIMIKLDNVIGAFPVNSSDDSK